MKRAGCAATRRALCHGDVAAGARQLRRATVAARARRSWYCTLAAMVRDLAATAAACMHSCEITAAWWQQLGLAKHTVALTLLLGASGSMPPPLLRACSCYGCAQEPNRWAVTVEMNAPTMLQLPDYTLYIPKLLTAA